MEEFEEKKINRSKPFIEYESKGISLISIDTIKQKKQFCFTISGIEICFPYRPYNSQLVYMNKVIEALNTKTVAALESPTGTGKTLCLLCSTLAWAAHQRKLLKQEEEQNGEKMTPPVVYFSTRTHSQISNALKELQKTIYQPKTCILSAREHLCVNNIAKEAHGSLNMNCRKMRKNKECRFFEKSPSNNIPENADIEELGKLGLKQGFCPFYFQRNKLAKAELIFLPYNYIFDYRLREAVKINLSLNSIILIDEAHNMANSCEESKSFELSYKLIDEVLYNLKTIGKIVENNVIGVSCKEKEVKEQELFLMNIKNYIKIAFQPKKGNNWPDIGQKINIDEFFKIFLIGGKYGDNLQKSLKEEKQVSPQFLTQNITTLKKINEDIEIQLTKTIENYIDFIEVTNNLYLDYLKNNSQNINTLLSNYKIFVQDEDNYFSYGVKSKDQFNRKLNLFCFNPGFTFGEIQELTKNCIIITSGTLSPIEGLESELKCNFGVKLENSHVIEKDQVSFNILNYSPFNNKIIYQFDMNSRGNKLMQEDLGKSISEFCKCTPGGILVFFTSFLYLKTCKDYWADKQILSLMSENKEMFYDDNDGKSDLIMKQYKKCNEGKGKGGILFSVLRGRFSEGIDFSDNLARLVIIVGIPYPSMIDVKVQLKKEYLSEAKHKKKLSPSDWYTESATRAVNQALGRVIRHIDDFGSIVLIDIRYSELNNRRVFSSWLREIAKKYDMNNSKEIFNNLSSFYMKMPGNKIINLDFIKTKKETRPISSNYCLEERKKIEEIIQKIQGKSLNSKLNNELVTIDKEKIKVEKKYDNLIPCNIQIVKEKEKEKEKDFIISDELFHFIMESVNEKNEKENEIIQNSNNIENDNLIDIIKNNCYQLEVKENNDDNVKLEEIITSTIKTEEKIQITLELTQENVNIIAQKSNIPIENSKFYSCPICFELKQKMEASRCGHIVCKDCWTNLFKLSDEKGKTKCPVCKQTNKKKDLRAIYI